MNKIGQVDIIKELERVKKPVPASYIAQKLGVDPRKIFPKLKQMIIYQEIKFIEVDRKEALEKYNCNHRMKLYFIED